MAGLIRVRSPGGPRRRAGLSFGPEWQQLERGEVNEAQLLAVLEDQQLQVQVSGTVEIDAEPEWETFPDRDDAIEALREHVANDIEHGRPHDTLPPPPPPEPAQEPASQPTEPDADAADKPETAAEDKPEGAPRRGPKNRA